MAVPYFFITREGVVAFDAGTATGAIVDAATYTYVVARVGRNSAAYSAFRGKRSLDEA